MVSAFYFYICVLHLQKQAVPQIITYYGLDRKMFCGEVVDIHLVSEG